jgi:2-alkyl-3-oxoalkanoate reductase
MRVFVAGASGVIGRRLVPMLVEHGHEVTGMTRSAERAERLRKLGAEPVICDVFDRDDLRSKVAARAPEAVVHELTDLPAAMNPRRMAEELANNNRIREQGTRNLVDAALAAGARRMVGQSIAFAYDYSGDRLKTEDDPLFDDAPADWLPTVKALHVLADTVTNTDGLEGMVLRYGFFYGPGSAYDSDGHYAREVRRGRFPIIGSGAGVFSFIHVDDAAAATVAALERGTPGIYNVVDDEPAPVREWLPAYAEALGAKKPRRVPKLVARVAAGAYTTRLTTELRGASNLRAKAGLNWEPRYPSWREGFREALG